jgi:GH18 family chitinase
MKKIICIILCAVMLVPLFAGCSKSQQSTATASTDFRVTAYVTADSIEDLSSFDAEHINEVTDVILFGVANFDEQGNVVLADNFETCYKNIKTVIGSNDRKLYLNILGPDADTDSDDWYEQMADKAKRHTKAFESGVLEQNIKNVLNEYGFDGVFFDYEYPIKSKYWKPYNKFIVSLDETLGNAFKIGMALASWDLGQSKQAMEVTDFVEIMSYDLWDDDGNHATMSIAEDDINKFIKAGYDKSRLDLGLPFYARPTTKESYWYSYRDYYEDIDENGLYEDSETGLTFSFNTKALIKDKTSYAVDMGLGGVMVWNWACDCEYGNDASLFGAIDEVRQVAMMKDTE